MFEAAELGHSIPKTVYEKKVPQLRMELLDTQYDVKDAARFPVIVLINGVEGAGKGETVNLLNEWMDPRFIQNTGFSLSSDEERERPPMWRFWRALPPKGKIGVLFGSWYTDPIVQRVTGEIDNAKLEQAAAEINRFEKMLIHEGACLVKFWFHLSKKAQKLRFKTLQADPKTSWRVSDLDWERFKQYDKFVKVCERTLRQTSTGDVPWHVVEGADAHYRNLTVAGILLDAMRKHLQSATGEKRAATDAPALLPSIDNVHILKKLDLTPALDKKDYKTQLEKYQGKLNLLCRHKKFRKRSVVAVFEGFDAAGKGGAIRRVTGALDARMYSVIPIAAPSEEERAQPYLWRFWRHIPRRGRFAIFDRSWYGRVLVERVEGFCKDIDWMRAYGEINDFETQLADHGIILAKFFLVIDKEEQLQRFNARKKIGFKRFKITDEDWRNREQWPLYETAVSDMVERTSTDIAPWTLVEANNKYHARVKVLRTLCKTLQQALD